MPHAAHCAAASQHRLKDALKKHLLFRLLQPHGQRLPAVLPQLSSVEHTQWSQNLL